MRVTSGVSVMDAIFGCLKQMRMGPMKYLKTSTFIFLLSSAFGTACGGSSGDDEATGGGSSGGSDGSGANGSGANGSGANGSGGTISAGASSGSGASSSGGAGEDDVCSTTTKKAKQTPANLLFVVDKSGSMNCNPPEGDEDLNAKCENFPEKEYPDEPSKWEVTSEALASALDGLAEQTNVSAGVTLFPNDDSCGVSEEPDIDIVTLDSDGRASIGDLLDSVEPEGQTPIAGSTILSYAHLSEQLVAGELKGNTFIVLLTDGAETCKDSELPKLLDEDVPNARLFNIRTFVIGAPGSEGARSLLSQIAFKGGTATSADCNHSDEEADEGDCHFDMTTSTDFAADLQAALKEISQTKVLTCSFDLPSDTEVDLDKVNVIYTPGDGSGDQDILQDDTASCDEASGWQYSDDKTKIELCGDVCSTVRDDAEGKVQIVLGCPTEMVK